MNYSGTPMGQAHRKPDITTDIPIAFVIKSWIACTELETYLAVCQQSAKPIEQNGPTEENWKCNSNFDHHLL